MLHPIATRTLGTTGQVSRSASAAWACRTSTAQPTAMERRHHPVPRSTPASLCSTPATSTARATTRCRSARRWRRAPRRRGPQRQIRGAAGSCRRLRGLRQPPEADEELPRLLARSSRHRSRRHLPTLASRSGRADRGHRWGDRRHVGRVMSGRSASPRSAPTPSAGPTPFTRSPTSRSNTRCCRAVPRPISCRPAGSARHRLHGLRCALPRPAQRPLVEGAWPARISAASARASRARISTATWRWSRHCARSPTARAPPSRRSPRLGAGPRQRHRAAGRRKAARAPGGVARRNGTHTVEGRPGGDRAGRA